MANGLGIDISYSFSTDLLCPTLWAHSTFRIKSLESLLLEPNQVSSSHTMVIFHLHAGLLVIHVLPSFMGLTQQISRTVVQARDQDYGQGCGSHLNGAKIGSHVN